MKYARIIFVASFVAVLVAVALLSRPTRDASADTRTDFAAQREAPGPGDSDMQRARYFLGVLQRTYGSLDGVTVAQQQVPGDFQAVAQYTTGRIVIDPDHTATVEDILSHEVWHVIDWRDNGRIDWGENLPPADKTDYLR